MLLRRAYNTMLSPLVFLYVWCVCFVAAQSSSDGQRLTSSLGPVVNLGYAAFAGNTTSPAGVQNSTVAFYGNIPYAQPPLADLRWRAPKTLNEGGIAREVADARNWGPACIQRPAVVGIGSEDCLKLNIWKPTSATANAKLPVAVYIHGGGFYYGAAQGFPLYDWVAQHSSGLVGVAITYRLGLLGFLGGKTLAADGDLNAGLLDQRAALEWIQRHISKFGGDPDNVTIIGESAGGASTIMQTTAYGGTRAAPFKRAVSQSTGFGPTRTDAQVEETFTNAAGFVGCPASGRDAMLCLRKASTGAIVSAINRTPNGQFAPIVDGPNGIMPDLPSRLIQQGRISTVDFLGGYCTGDGKHFAGGPPTAFNSDEDIKRLVFSRWPSVSNSTMDKALALYPSPDVPGSPFATHWDRAWTMAGEIIYSSMSFALSEKLISRGVKNVFSYSWNAPHPELYAAAPYRGAAHTSDLFFLFSGTNTFGNAGNTFRAFNASEATLSKEAIAHWSTFAQVGNPSSNWEAYEAPDPTSPRRRLFIDKGDASVTSSKMENIPPNELERCRFWMSEDVVKETRV